MLIYHPAFDPNHGIFRFLGLLDFLSPNEIGKENLKHYDFFLLFPSLITKIKLPKKIKKPNIQENHYGLMGTAEGMYKNISTYQEHALRILAAQGFIETSKFSQNIVQRTSIELPTSLLERVRQYQEENKDLFLFFKELHKELPFNQKKGLKERAGIKGVKYDL